MKSKNRITNKILFSILAFIGGIAFIFPLLWMISASFKYNSRVFQDPLLLFERSNFTLANFTTVFKQPFGTWYYNSLFIGIIGVLLRLTFNSLAAFAFAKLNFRGKDKVFIIFLATMMVPIESIIIPQYMIYRSLHLINNLLVLIIPNGFDAFSIFFLRQAFQIIPKELSESAFVDGSSNFKIFYKIIIPLSKTAILSLSILTFFGLWDKFFEPLIFLTSVDKYTIPIGLQLLSKDRAVNIAAQMAGSSLAIIPTLLLFFIFQKAFIESIATSGLKG